MTSSSPEPMTWQDDLASLISDRGIRYFPAGVDDSDRHPPVPLSSFEVEEDESNVNQSEKSLKEEAKEFMKATGEMLIELGKGVRDIAKQSMVGADELYYVRIGKKKMKEVGKRLEFLNDYVLPEDKDPVYSWIVVISVAFLAISAMCVNSGHQASVSVESPKKLYLHPPSATRIQLPDGRHIAYHEQGVTVERARFSLVAPHAFLSSRLAGIPGIKSSLLEEFGVRLVTYDLPGFGESDPHPGRDLNSSAEDMMHLANSVGISENFWVMGYSGGGKHAWAAVRYIPEKLAGVAMFAPMCNPYDSSLTNEERYRTWEKWTSRRKFMFILARRFPAFLPYFYKRSFLSGIQGRLEKWLMLSLGKKDRALVEEVHFKEFWERDVEESVRQRNAKPFVEEAVLEVSDWGFRLADLQVQKKHDLDMAQVSEFVKERLGVEVEMSGCKAPITTFIVEPFVPHDEEYYLNIVSERLGCSISFSECGGIDIEENWDKVKTIFLPTEKPLSSETCAPLIATLPLEVKEKIGAFIQGVFSVFQDLDMSFLEMNPFTMLNGEPYPLDMRGELDDTAAFKNFKKWGNIEFPLPFGRVLSPTESFIHGLDEKTSASLKFTVLNPKGRIWTMVAGGGASVIYADTVGDLGYANELGNYAEYSGAPNEEEVLQYARVVLDCATADPDGRKRALLIGGGIANFTDVAATFNGIIRAIREKESKIKAARMHIYVRRGGPNYQTGLAKMRALGAEIGVPLEVYGPEATMTGICKEAINCVMAEA